jgi:hypothetical protein
MDTKMTYRKFPKYDARKYQCCVFPWLKARHIHHTTYKGPEWLWLDMLPVSMPAHRLIHVVAGGSGRMVKAVTIQNRRARSMPLAWLWRYPNPLQRCIHAWGRVPNVLKWAGLWLALLWLIAPEFVEAMLGVALRSA